MTTDLDGWTFDGRAWRKDAGPWGIIGVYPDGAGWRWAPPHDYAHSRNESPQWRRMSNLGEALRACDTAHPRQS